MNYRPLSTCPHELALSPPDRIKLPLQKNLHLATFSLPRVRGVVDPVGAKCTTCHVFTKYTFHCAMFPIKHDATRQPRVIHTWLTFQPHVFNTRGR
jgi:hypothetical protein